MNFVHAAIDWTSMFSPKENLVELFLRTSTVYLGILAIMRIFRRQKGALNAADLLVLVLVADAAQNGIAINYQSLTEAAVVVGTIFLWDYALDAAAFRSPRFARFINGQPLILIRDGQLNRANMRSEMLTRDDVLEQLREQGVTDLRKVRCCYLETDGHFSVLTDDECESVQPTQATRSVV